MIGVIPKNVILDILLDTLLGKMGTTCQVSGMKELTFEAMQAF